MGITAVLLKCQTLFDLKCNFAGEFETHLQFLST